MPRKNARKKIRNLIDSVKASSSCYDCGHNQELTFDHRPGEVKRFDLAQGPKYSLSLVLHEMSKCHIVCIPCHRKREDDRLFDDGYQTNKKMMEAVCQVFRLFSILVGNEAAYKEFRDIHREKEKKRKDRKRYRRSKQKVNPDTPESIA